ncbi:DUF211 domain-containing protein [Halomicroarcula sp. GCM10025324]|uniref:DUF211 domain-containing protein n=1 Tax=Haloarcula TaxID=2237 RepID=UPI0023E7F9DF|nr:DUF211 domain-containing protein [Halomicroarcula sp. ZS-22-S1]
MVAVRRLVLDVLKPHSPRLTTFTEQVTEAESVAGATVSLVELDQEVQTIKLTLEGESVAYDEVETIVEGLGATVHSIDEVSCGEYVVEERATFQDA